MIFDTTDSRSDLIPCNVQAGIGYTNPIPKPLATDRNDRQGAGFGCGMDDQHNNFVVNGGGWGGWGVLKVSIF